MWQIIFLNVSFAKPFFSSDNEHIWWGWKQCQLFWEPPRKFWRGDWKRSKECDHDLQRNQHDRLCGAAPDRVGSPQQIAKQEFWLWSWGKTSRGSRRGKCAGALDIVIVSVCELCFILLWAWFLSWFLDFKCGIQKLGRLICGMLNFRTLISKHQLQFLLC